MKIISTKTHGILDYVVGVILIVAPWVLGFAAGGAETWVPVILGAGTIVYSLLTDYEYGAYRTISMQTHLWLDGFAGLFLAASPWLFGFADFVFWPHLILGILELGAVMMTETTPAIQEHDGVERNDRDTQHYSGAQNTTGNRMHDSQRETEHKAGIHRSGATAATISNSKVANESDRTRADDKTQSQVNTQARKEQNESSNNRNQPSNPQNAQPTTSHHSTSERSQMSNNSNNQGRSTSNNRTNPTSEKSGGSTMTGTTNSSNASTGNTAQSTHESGQKAPVDLPHEKAHTDLNNSNNSEKAIASENTNTIKSQQKTRTTSNESNQSAHNPNMGSKTGSSQENSPTSQSSMDTPSSDRNLSDIGSQRNPNADDANSSWNKKATTGNRDSQQERNAQDIKDDSRDKS